VIDPNIIENPSKKQKKLEEIHEEKSKDSDRRVNFFPSSSPRVRGRTQSIDELLDGSAMTTSSAINEAKMEIENVP